MHANVPSRRAALSATLGHVVFAAALLAAIQMPVHAQCASSLVTRELARGTRVRATMTGNVDPVIGRFARSTDTELLLVRGNDTLTLDAGALVRLEQSAGAPKVEHAVEGGAAAALVGMLLGYHHGAHQPGEAAAFASMDDAILGVLVGAIVGAGIGALLTRERWELVCGTSRPGT